jgi:hypothetical protein
MAENAVRWQAVLWVQLKGNALQNKQQKTQLQLIYKLSRS